MRSSHARVYALLLVLGSGWCRLLANPMVRHGCESVQYISTPSVGVRTVVTAPTPATGNTSTPTASRGNLPVPTAPPLTPAATKPVDPAPPRSADTMPSMTATLPTRAQRPSLMIRKYGKELEWRSSYSHSSRNAVYIDGVAINPILVIGSIGVERIRKDTVVTSLAGRYGLADNMLGELKIPLRFESNLSSVPDVSPPQEKSMTGFGLGDIEGSLYYQLPRAREEDVRWVMNLGLKSNTGADAFATSAQKRPPLGSGFWNTKLGVTGVKISEPAAVFWSAGYTVNWARHQIPVTITNAQDGSTSIVYVDIKPAKSIDVGGGFAYAINPKLSINTGVSISWNGAAHSNGKRVPNSIFTAASLRLGAVWLTEKRLPVDLGLNIGLTDDSPDFSLEFRQNYKL